MTIKGVSSRLYQKVCKECKGFQNFPEVTRTMHTKDGQRTITQTVFKNGDYNTEVWRGRDLVKFVEKRNRQWGSQLNTWDFIKAKGKVIENVYQKPTDAFEQRVYDKIAPFKVGESCSVRYCMARK